MIKIYHNPRCRKSRETLAILQAQNEPFEVIEYLKQIPTFQDLEKATKALAIEPQEIVRKGELVYKEKYKGKDLSNQEWLQALVQNPILIERPIVIKGEKAVIGRPPENVNALF